MELFLEKKYGPLKLNPLIKYARPEGKRREFRTFGLLLVLVRYPEIHVC